MSQKINLTSVKLGTSQIWSNTFPKYGKNFKYYNKSLQLYNIVFIYITRFIKSHNLFVNSVNIRTLNQKSFLNITFLSLKKPTNFCRINKLFKTIFYWLKKPIILNVYRKTTLVNSAFLITNYITFLTIDKTSPKKVLKNIYDIIKKQSNNFKLVRTTTGIKKVQISGFKLRFSGCFGISKNQMAKTINYNFGPLPSTTLNNYTEYSYNTLYTKFGTCGLKVWLFYKFTSV